MAGSSTLQSEAGYIDARPHLPELTKPLAPHGRTIHLGQNENPPPEGLCQLPPAADITAVSHVGGARVPGRIGLASF